MLISKRITSLEMQMQKWKRAKEETLSFRTIMGEDMEEAL